MHRRLILLALLLACASSAAWAEVLRVPQQYPTVGTALAAAGPGDTVRVSAGTYSEAGNLVVAQDGVVLQAKGKVILDARPLGPLGSGPGLTVTGADVTIQGFILQHAKGDPGHGVHVLGPRCLLKDLQVRHADGAAVRVDAADVSIEGCTIQACADGIVVAADGFTVRNTSVDNVHGDGIHVEGMDTRVEGCRVTNVNGSGLAVLGNDVMLRANKVSGTRLDGIVVQGTGLALMDNHVRYSGQAGLRVVGATNGSVAGNDIAFSREQGLFLSEVIELVIEKNTLDGCGTRDEASLLLQGGVCAVLGNSVRRGAEDGLVILGDDCTVADNTLKQNGEDGLEILGSRTLVQDNLLLDNLGEGLDNKGQDTQASGNKLKGNRTDVVNAGSFLSFEDNNWSSGGPSAAPEIDDGVPAP